MPIGHTKRIIEMHVNALDGEKEELRRKFLAELDSLGSEAKSAAPSSVVAIMRQRQNRNTARRETRPPRITL